MFINLTNHPSALWSEEQLKAAEKYGEIVDIPFPCVNEEATEAEIKQLADHYSTTIMSMGNRQDLIVHVMGEQTFCYALISKLQKEGIRCIASCTEHDTFFNEEGQKVSTFHFTRFREYYPQMAFCWWEYTKKFFCASPKRKANKKERFSWIALALLLLAEIAIVCFLQTGLSLWKWISISFASVLLLLYIIGKRYHLKFRIRSTIVSKLLANAISPSSIGTSYLLAFVIHIGWLTNAVHGLFSTNGEDFLSVSYSVAICAIGLFFLIIFFPDGRQKKDENHQQVFFTGISSINVKEEAWPKKYDALNIIPLVRILQLLNDKGNGSRMVILLTDAFKNDDKTSKVLKHIMTLVNPKATAELERHETIEGKLALLIREVAKREFPNKERQIETMEIEFTKPCSYYEDFEVAFNLLENKAKELDDTHHQLYFNLTPGTGIIGSLMTLMAIDGDRKLFYYSQEKMPNETTATDEEKELFKEKLLKPIDKSKVPLQALLSQALESIG